MLTTSPIVRRAFVCAGALLIGGTASFARDLTAGEKKIISEAVSHDFFDPESARFRWSPVANCQNYFSCYMGFYCGMVNAKNRFGGYVGFTPFAVMISRGRDLQITKASLMDVGDGTDEKTQQVLKFCMDNAVKPG